MRKVTFPLLILTLFGLLATSCGGREEKAADASSLTQRATAKTDPLAEASPTAAPPLDVEADSPTPTEIPSGTVALFYRASFGTDTERLPTTEGDIVWETGRRGIVRYIPETGQIDVLKAISSPSYSKSAIYPMTIGSKLFVIRDWGSDWISKNKHFGIEELDPRTGMPLSSTDINAEWFTLLEDQVYFRHEVKTDLFGNPSGGGELMVQNVGSPQASELPDRRIRFHSVGEHLVSLAGSDLQQHSRSTGDVQAARGIGPALMDGSWPVAGNVFYGEDGIYVAVEGARVNEIDIIRVPLVGAQETLFTFRLQEGENGLVIDESQDVVLIGLVGSTPPFDIKRLLLFNVEDESVQQVDVDQYIPSARQELGGGIQVLVVP